MSSRSIQFAWRLERLFSLLLWLTAAATSTSAAPLREGDYYRPLPPEASGRVATTAAYRRSPCPAINALANHGYIARDGRAITAQALKAAVMKHFAVDARYADTLVALAKKPVFDLNELSAHNVVEHDMSLVHKDAFFGQDPAIADAALVADLVGHVGATGVLDPWFFARTQQRRLRECMVQNPQCEFSNAFLLSVTLGRQGLLMRVMGGQNEEAVDLETARMLLVEEKLEANWTSSTRKPVSQDDIQNSRRRLTALLQASGEWLGDGGDATAQTLVSDANVTQCLHTVNKTVVVTDCNEAKTFVLDGQQRLRVTGGGCLEVATSSVIEIPCSENFTTAQQWRYDASGRLRPVQAPDSCLDLVQSKGSDVSVTMATCSTRTEQRFVSFYANFQPSASQLTSMHTPRFCLGLTVGETAAPTSSASSLASRPLVATPCDTLDESQELTLDERNRLAFAYDTTQCLDLLDSVTLVQTSCSDRSTKWQYDSLSRLRPSSQLAKCIQLSPGGGNQRPLALADCADGLEQKWYISGTRDPDFRPADQFYRPNVFELSGKPGTTATYSRSPCPALNALANHGLLPRSGRNLTAQQLQQAVVDHFNIDPSYAQVLVQLATSTNRRAASLVSFNLDALSLHNAAEHDMSLVHADAFFGQDPAVTDPTLAAELVRHVGVSGNMGVLFFARTQARRVKECQARNPQCDFSNEFLMSVALGRLGLLMRAMGGQNQELVALDRARSFLLDEQIPADFTKSPTPVTQKDIQDTRIRIDKLLASSSDWLVHGFLNSRTGVSIVSDASHGLCLAIGSNGSATTTETNAVLVTATCDKAKREQKWRMDDLHRVVSEASGLCLAALEFGTQSGTSVVQLECVDDASNQLWTYDASGRLRPAHAATLCLDVSSTGQKTKNETGSMVKAGSKVALAACGATSQQRFYSIYGAFQPNASHLSSIEYPDLCVGVAGASTTDGARVTAVACDPGLMELQLMKDAGGRLAFTHSAKCLTHDSSGMIVQATCSSDAASQQWLYDSLGRLHPASMRSQCLTMRSPGSGSASVMLNDCSDSPVQRWYAPEAKDPNNRPQNAYYRPNRDESSGRVGTTATYSRSPCPALNALANHGILRRDGRNISRIDLVGAVVATFNIEPALAESFLSGLPDDHDYLNLDDLSGGTFEYKGSLLHSDAFFNPDPAAVDPDLVSDLFAREGSENTVDLVYVAAAQHRRLDAHAHTVSTPVETTLSAVKYQKAGLLLRVLGGTNQGTVAAETARLLLVEERIPDAFVKPSVAVTLSNVLDSASTVRAIIETGATRASGQGATSVAWLSQPFQPKREPVYAFRKDGVVSCLSLTNGVVALTSCNATNTAQLFTYDDQQRLVVDDTGSCLDVIDGKLGNGVAVSHIDCTDWRHQKWVYDASGRLHPQHAPKFCLSVGSTGKGVLARCSDSPDQQFFTAFNSLAMTDKQLVSAATARQGPLTYCLSVRAGSGPGIEQCDDAKPQQLFSLDDTQRLATQVSGRCVSTASDGRSLATTDCTAQPLAWAYDSLGRVHLQTSMALCLTANADTNVVSVETCSTSVSQRWLVARLTSRTSTNSSGDGPGKMSAGTTTSPRNAGRVAMALMAASLLVR